MAEDFSIPLIDLAPLHQAGNAPRVEVLEKISKACEEWGFFQVINHDLDLKLLSSLFQKKRKPRWKPAIHPWDMPTAENLILEARKTASFLVKIMSESLGLPNEQRLENLYKAGDALIMLKYPACPEGYEGPVLAKHRDGDILTIVAQLNNAQGLEVLHEKDQQEIWVPVKPVENALVINVGDVLQVKSLVISIDLS
ncbi:1-aminocyclopropane-1-carboxylate oxidase homolog 8 [Selaginella moellendorffii]|uniref:1-aminocyclopropane-1-carboxylate oxidase homolog 8 n=1 Tax=Selaginella moellendorffii TaxID=88036 RepID=UPI000D1C5CB2|nr:1-aminocyclopropane-1-carboxylate oxidase homolog 8 [Selaginella moellendorffii]|eukprot:XP_024543119.1 1-aminocyclopropane-1-carboxylate oxidase homolog 8 [Selaginella moellendorffii]